SDSSGRFARGRCPGDLFAMLRPDSSSRRWTLTFLGLWLSVAAMVPQAARAQLTPGDSLPSQVYYNTFPLYYDGDYRAAAGAFLNSGGIKTPNGRWIDSICYLTMAGESYYQLGQL